MRMAVCMLFVCEIDVRSLRQEFRYRNLAQKSGAEVWRRVLNIGSLGVEDGWYVQVLEERTRINWYELNGD